MDDEGLDVEFHNEWFLREFDVSQLIGYILLTYHAGLRRELPKIESMVGDVLRFEGAYYPVLSKVRESFRDFRRTIERHMKEEERLFTFFLLLGAPEEFLDLDWSEILDLSEINKMEDDRIQGHLAEIRELTGDYSLTGDLDGNYDHLMRRFMELEFQLKKHIWIETRLLFPKVTGLIRKQLTRSSLAIGGGD
jgi:iron-sulfur cluster repair protein YtfE (RIC family)